MQVALQFQQCYLGAQNAGNESSCHAILKLSFGYCCRMGLRSHENIHIMQIIVWQRLQNWRICSVHFSSLTFKVVVEIRSVATEKCLNFRITSAWNRLSSFKTLFESREETLTVTSCNSSSAYTSSLSRKVESSTKCHTFQSFSDFFFL